ncbi:MAG: hypothetical protein Kow0077_19440 [Anaerolineae bacterium]
MTLKLTPGHNLSDEELARLEALIQQEYPDEDVIVVYDDRPAPAAAPAQQGNLIQKLFVLVVTLIAGLYLANPTAGILELIPDVTPVVGNLDEATAMALLISGLSYFGVNVGWLTHIFGGLRRRQ